jgi:Family of unknown function (DUF6084)
MPDLNFQITGVEAVAHGLTPLLHFKLQVTNEPSQETIHAVMLHAQIQIESPQRAYNAREQEGLTDLFGAPERWGQTLRNRLWSHSNTNVRTFTGSTDATLPIPCTYDLNVTATKFFHALEGGEVPLLFLFSGTLFYATPEGMLQAQQISWNKECQYRMPVKLWREMMEQHYPNTYWFYLHRDSFERLYAYRRRHGMASWEQTIDRLLRELEKEEVPA